MTQKTNVKRIISEIPGQMLTVTVRRTRQIGRAFPNGKVVIKKSKDYWESLGPGLTTGASDDDPSGIATYSQTGAQYGFQFLWLSVFTYPLMSVVQEMCARIGLVTGRGLAANIRQHYSKKVLYTCAVLLFGANAFNIGANLGAMAKAVQLLVPGANYVLLLFAFTAVCLLLQIYTPYARYAKYLKWLALVLLTYILSAFLADLQWAEIGRSLIHPHMGFDKEQILLVCAILGTTISPYLFFWQTSQEVEEEILNGHTTIAQRQMSAPSQVRKMRIDVWSGMLLSNLVMFFIIAACGGILFTNGINEITSAAQAAEALRPFAGDATYFLFAIGIIGTGMLAIPVLAGASSYALSESFKWREGMYRKLHQAHAFYGVIIVSMFVGLGINFIGIDPFKALIYSAVANGIVAPVVLVLIVRLSSNRRIMGDWVNKRSISFIGWITTLLMAAAGIAAIIAMF
jgi:NRAMP (natural resistance-associated macrophage protein)-like metal ion transporter